MRTLTCSRWMELPRSSAARSNGWDMMDGSENEGPMRQHNTTASMRAMASPVDRPQGAREGEVGLPLQLRFVRPYVTQRDRDDDETDDHQGDGDGLLRVKQRGPEQVSAETIDDRPDHAARRIGDEEALPFHPVHPGEEGGEHAQHGDEPAEEHHLAAVAQEQVLPELDARLREADVAPVAQQQRVAELAPQPIADVVAEDRAERGRADHAGNVQIGM